MGMCGGEERGGGGDTLRLCFCAQNNPVLICCRTAMSYTIRSLHGEKSCIHSSE